MMKTNVGLRRDGKVRLGSLRDNAAAFTRTHLANITSKVVPLKNGMPGAAFSLAMLTIEMALKVLRAH